MSNRDITEQIPYVPNILTPVGTSTGMNRSNVPVKVPTIQSQSRSGGIPVLPSISHQGISSRIQNIPAISSVPSRVLNVTTLTDQSESRPIILPSVQSVPKTINPPVNIPQDQKPIFLVPGAPNGRVNAVPVMPPPNLTTVPIRLRQAPMILRTDEGSGNLFNNGPHHNPVKMVINHTNRRPQNAVQDETIAGRVVPRYQHDLAPTNTKPVVVTVRPVEEEYIELPTTNPYMKLPMAVINAIIREREVEITGTRIEKALQLFAYDTIMPDWLQSIQRQTIESSRALSDRKTYVFGALNGVDFERTPDIQARDLHKYVSVSILLNTPGHRLAGMLGDFINSLNRPMLEIFARNFGVQARHCHFISVEDLKTILRTRNSAHLRIKDLDDMANRYLMLSTHKYSNLLSDLYDVDGDNDAWINVSRSLPHPMENIIINLDVFPLGDIINSFGILVPLLQSDNQQRYVHDNIVAYNQFIVGRTNGIVPRHPIEALIYMQRRQLVEYFNQLTDKEIFNTMGVYIPYRSRRSLIDAIVNSISQNRFMYPLLRTKTRSINDTTLMATEIVDIDTFMVCYGTPLKYHTYEIIELLNAFHRSNDGNAIGFRRPENPKTYFNEEDINGLLELLKCFHRTQEITDLIGRIEEGLIDAKEAITFDITARMQLDTFDKPNRELIREYLHSIFITGMYMRRWQGPGHPYPLASADTRTKKEPDIEVSDGLNRGKSLLDRMSKPARSFCFKLKICQYGKGGSIEHGTEEFKGEWDNVWSGTQCIRMASTKFIGTAYHFLRALYKETIPGLKTDALDRIV